MLFRIATLLLFFFSFQVILAQNADSSTFVIKKISSPITIDGVLDEAVWKEAQVAKSFYQYFPYDTSKAVTKTEIRLAYDDNFLYISSVSFDTLKGNYYIASLRRDFRGSSNDGISIVIDPFQDRQNGFLFGVSPAGVQREGLVVSGSEESLDLSWDNKWYSEARIEKGVWVSEMAIPFKTLRFKEGSQRWNMNFYRIDSKTNERSTWSKIPRNMELFALAYTKEVMFEKPLKKTGSNVSVIPYLGGGASKDYRTDAPSKNSFNVGADAKIAVTSSLNLDLTINPDFSQVEVDQQVTNLDRFEIFFPERRQFFLENADLFSNFGFQRMRPFFSRRIGVARDQSTGQNLQNKIWFGARLSGRIDKNWRVGLLNMQAAKDDAIGLPSMNYTVGVVQRKMFTRSNLAAIMVNKQNFLDQNSDFTLGSSQYNRLLGLDYNLASADNKWTGKLFYHQTFSPTQTQQNFSQGGNINYNTQKLAFGATYGIIGDDFDAQVGYVPRKNYRFANASVRYNWFPKSKIINRYGIGASGSVNWTKEYGYTDRSAGMRVNISGQDNSYFETGVQNDYVYLFFPFDPTNTGGKQLAEGSQHRMTSVYFFGSSDFRKPLYGEGSVFGGQYYNGHFFGFRGTVNYRFRQYAIFSLNMEHNKIRLPEPYSSADLWLVGPRFDITFSRNLFWTTFIQYNNQIDNVNINARFQWRFKPVSDLFVVYTDNYFAEHLKVKNRAIVLKLTYWFNL